jgi:O-antigen/teichoic acid export membrane protein
VTESALPRTALLRGGGLVLAAFIVWNGANYAFVLLAGRELGPSDYGLLAALLAAMQVVAVPASSLQFAAARLLAAPPAGQVELAEGIYRRVWRRCAVATPIIALAACIAILIASVAAPEIPTGPLLLTAAATAPLGLFFLALGRLLGEQRFGAYSLCFALWGAPRPLVLLPLVALGLGVYAALGATGAAVAAALSTCIWLTRGARPMREPSTDQWRAFTWKVVPVVAGLAALGLLANLDVIVARIALSAHTAGQFAAVATLAKAIFLVPQAVSSVLLPRVAARSAAAEDTGILIGLGVGVTLAVGGLASVVVGTFAEPLLRITFGEDFTASAGLLAPYVGASTLIGALLVAIYHHIGRSADRFVWGAVGLAALMSLLFVGLHGSQGTIVAVDAIVGVTGLLVHECLFFRTREAIVPGLVRAARLAHMQWREAA